MIRIDEIWLSTQPMDMRAGMDTTMAQVVRAFGLWYRIQFLRYKSELHWDATYHFKIQFDWS